MIHLIPLLRQNLKDDEIIDLLEHWDCDVIYDLDRLREGTPDQYWVSVHDEGLQFLFDDDQKVSCIFLHVNPTDGDGFQPATIANTDVPQLTSIDDARAYAESNALTTTEGRAELFGQLRDWIKIEFVKHTIHYEFRNGGLGLVTVSRTS